jgi:DNA segregation ATPase FtsK/SpoIIIE, S-DNA-T family
MEIIEPVEVAVLDDDGVVREVTLRLRDADVTVDDLAAALGGTGATVLIDGQTVAGSTPLTASGLRRGSLLTRRPSAPPSPPVAATLRWTGGLDAGTTQLLGSGLTVIGRAPRAGVRCRDRRVAPYHCVVDAGPNGVVVQPLVPMDDPAEGRWRIGGREAEVVAARSRPAPTVPSGSARPGDWTVSLSRPPRPAIPPPPAAVRAPRSEAVGGRSLPAGGLVGALLSVAGSVLAAVAFGQPALLVLGGMGAVGSIASWAAHHRRGVRSARAGHRRAHVELTAFAGALAAQTAAETTRRRTRAVELVDAVARARAVDARLWERRPLHDDHLEVVLGIGTVPWAPIVEGLGEEPPAAVAAVLAGHGRLVRVPVTLTMRPGVVLGLVGDDQAARAVARSLVVQLAVTTGPADLAIGVRSHAIAGWTWARWLPHAIAPGDDAGDRPRLVVVDGPAVLAMRASEARAELTGRLGAAAGIVLAPDAIALPSCCTHIAVVADDATMSLVEVAAGTSIDGIVGAGASLSTAAEVARALAAFDDPELRPLDRGLPEAVELADLLGPDALDGAKLAAAWRALDRDPPPRAPVAISDDGVVEIDLVEHGPHALIAGTTGAGKSELLRSLVAGLAARSSPRDLTFVLIDYKGGSAFDACGSLPHVVGVVTDLDDRLAGRALRSLEAELRRRERVLRSAGAVDISDFRRGAHDEVLPRLVVVVDELAGLVVDLPDFVSALVGVAQRGRSLGIHLVLATQRPAGVVNDEIRANTNLRVALRVQSAADSHDVLGVADAAALRTDRPGRALIRLGPGDVVAVQVARASAPVPARDRPAVQVTTRSPDGSTAVISADGSLSALGATAAGPSGLERLVVAARHAVSELGLVLPRPPWLDPLPMALTLDDLPPGAVALADDPDHQAQHPVTWRRSDGHLLCVGIAGSGATATLASVALSAAAETAPSGLHLYVVDMGAGELASLSALPHCAAVLRAGEVERLSRLVRRLEAEVDRRRGGADGPELVVLIDGLEALRSAFDDPSGFAVGDALDRVIVDGATVGIHMAVTVDRPGALPVAIMAGIRQRWTFRMADGPSLPPGRALDADSGLELQVGVPRCSLAAACAATATVWRPDGGPSPLGVLTALVRSSELPPCDLTARPWVVPVAIADTDLAPASLLLHAGDHVFVGGRSRTGRSSTLVLLAERLLAAEPDLLVAVVALRPSPLRSCGAHVVVTGASDLSSLAVLGEGCRPTVLLVDDAERVDDDGTLAALVASGHPALHVVAAGRPDVVRSIYGHWTSAVRRSRLGMLLQPDVDLDGDLLGAVLPRRQVVAPLPGRGHLVVDGRAGLVQLAAPANMVP